WYPSEAAPRAVEKITGASLGSPALVLPRFAGLTSPTARGNQLHSLRCWPLEMSSPIQPMPYRTLIAAASCLIVTTLAAQAPPRPAGQERDFLSRVRRLTLEGRRAGEGYWSKDGQRLVFQSEREPGNPFYQIYTMDLATGDTMRVSPGMGKTTCS